MGVHKSPGENRIDLTDNGTTNRREYELGGHE